MYPVFESIKVVDHVVCNFDEHLERMNRTSWLLWKKSIQFNDIETKIEKLTNQGIYKCKLYYNAESFQLQCEPYQKRAIAKLFLVVDSSISYALKLSDRTCFTIHTNQLRPTDDILIIKDNLITDCSYANIALWNGFEWHTPMLPLLKGIKRNLLLKSGQLIEKNITVEQLLNYRKISLINAMLNLGETEIEMQHVVMA